MVSDGVVMVSDVTIRQGEAAMVADVPSRTGLGASEVAVVLPGLTVRMGGDDPAWGWVSLGVACLMAAARETWPAESPSDGLDFESTMSAWRAAALRSVADLAGWAASSADAWAVYAVPAVVRVARAGRSGRRRVWGGR